MKLSFKKDPPNTGLYAVAQPESHTQIKADKKCCGTIVAPNWQTPDHKWKIQLQVVDPKEPPKWKWIQFKARFDDEPSARQWLKDNWGKITTSMTLHLMDD